MCGRFVLTTPADALAAEFAALTGGLVLTPRYNIAPMTNVVVVRNVGGERTLSMLRWGLIPFWAKDPTIASKLINARSETAAEKPSFRDAVRRRRAVVPASGFYEWKRVGTRKQPWYFRPTVPASSLAIAALWETWRSPDDEVIETCCLLTTAANAVLAPVHDRMPVMLDRDGVEQWLDPSNTDAVSLQELLVPAAAERLGGYPVSSAVNAVRNDTAKNVEAIAEEEPPVQGGLGF